MLQYLFFDWLLIKEYRWSGKWPAQKFGVQGYHYTILDKERHSHSFTVLDDWDAHAYIHRARGG